MPDSAKMGTVGEDSGSGSGLGARRCGRRGSSACVTDGKYAAWVKANYDVLSAKFGCGGHPGTPDLYIDGTQFAAPDPNQVPAAQLQVALRAALDVAVGEQG